MLRENTKNTAEGDAVVVVDSPIHPAAHIGGGEADTIPGKLERTGSVSSDGEGAAPLRGRPNRSPSGSTSSLEEAKGATTDEAKIDEPNSRIDSLSRVLEERDAVLEEINECLGDLVSHIDDNIPEYLYLSSENGTPSEFSVNEDSSEEEVQRAKELGLFCDSALLTYLAALGQATHGLIDQKHRLHTTPDNQLASAIAEAKASVKLFKKAKEEREAPASAGRHQNPETLIGGMWRDLSKTHPAHLDEKLGVLATKHRELLQGIEGLKKILKSLGEADAHAIAMLQQTVDEKEQEAQANEARIYETLLAQDDAFVNELRTRVSGGLEEYIVYHLNGTVVRDIGDGGGGGGEAIAKRTEAIEQVALGRKDGFERGNGQRFRTWLQFFREVQPVEDALQRSRFEGLLKGTGSKLLVATILRNTLGQLHREKSKQLGEGEQPPFPSWEIDQKLEGSFRKVLSDPGYFEDTFLSDTRELFLRGNWLNEAQFDIYISNIREAVARVVRSLRDNGTLPLPPIGRMVAACYTLGEPISPEKNTQWLINFGFYHALYCGAATILLLIPFYHTPSDLPPEAIPIKAYYGDTSEARDSVGKYNVSHGEKIVPKGFFSTIFSMVALFFREQGVTRPFISLPKMIGSRALADAWNSGKEDVTELSKHAHSLIGDRAQVFIKQGMALLRLMVGYDIVYRDDAIRCSNPVTAESREQLRHTRIHSLYDLIRQQFQSTVASMKTILKQIHQQPPVQKPASQAAKARTLQDIRQDAIRSHRNDMHQLLSEQGSIPKVERKKLEREFDQMLEDEFGYKPEDHTIENGGGGAAATH